MNFESQPEKAKLNLPRVSRARYARNFIKNTVCELKFPIVLDLESKPPAKLQKQLKRAYPLYEVRREFNLVPNPGSNERSVYVLQSKKKDWTIQVKSDSLILETSRYVDFDDFLTRFEEVFGASADLLDTDFFTRVGFRYINEIPLESGEPDGWLNPTLYSVIGTKVLGTVVHEHHEYQGLTEFGGYTFRHGPTIGTTPNESGFRLVNYALDFDYWAENADIQDVVPFLKSTNETNFYFFRWCLGDKALESMGEATPK